jgi:hypothetical protein
VDCGHKKTLPAEADRVKRLKVCATDADAEHRQQQYGQHVMPFHNGRAENQCHAKDEHAKHAYNETD